MLWQTALHCLGKHQVNPTPSHQHHHTPLITHQIQINGSKAHIYNSAECSKDGRAHKAQVEKKNQIKGYCKSELPSRTVNPTWKPYFHNPQCNLQQTHRGLKGMIKATWVFTWTSDWVSCCRSIATAERPKIFQEGFFPSLHKNRYYLHTIWHSKYLMLMKP